MLIIYLMSWIILIIIYSTLKDINEILHYHIKYSVKVLQYNRDKNTLIMVCIINNV